MNEHDESDTPGLRTAHAQPVCVHMRMHCDAVTQAPHPLLCPDLDKWPQRDDDAPPCIGLSEDGAGVRLSKYSQTRAPKIIKSDQVTTVQKRDIKSEITFLSRHAAGMKFAFVVVVGAVVLATMAHSSPIVEV